MEQQSGVINFRKIIKVEYFQDDIHKNVIFFIAIVATAKTIIRLHFHFFFLISKNEFSFNICIKIITI